MNDPSHAILAFIVVGIVISVLLVRLLSAEAKSALDRLTRLEEKLDRLLAALNVPLTTTPLRPLIKSSLMSPSQPNTADLANSEVGDFLRQRKKINAIKVYREQTGLGLKDSKDAVDALEAEMRARGMI